MSQFFQGVSAGSLPPTVPLTFHTDNGDAVPAANTLNIDIASSIGYSDEGLKASGSGSTVTLTVTNTLTSSFTTNGAVNGVYSFSLGNTPYAFHFEGFLLGFDSSNNVGASFNIVETCRTDGVTATEIGVETQSTFLDAVLAACTCSIGVNGNNMRVEVTGVAGYDINWLLRLVYWRVA